MRTATPKRSASTKSSNSIYQKEAKHKVQITSQHQPGDMDILESDAGSPMPPAFEQIDRTYKTMHHFLGWPSPIV
ncbi:MAG: hypothetical protein ACXWIN_06130 [Burkholderiaceae bacterium]